LNIYYHYHITLSPFALHNINMPLVIIFITHNMFITPFSYFFFLSFIYHFASRHYVYCNILITPTPSHHHYHHHFTLTNIMSRSFSSHCRATPFFIITIICHHFIIIVFSHYHAWRLIFLSFSQASICRHIIAMMPALLIRRLIFRAITPLSDISP